MVLDSAGESRPADAAAAARILTRMQAACQAMGTMLTISGEIGYIDLA